MSKRTPSDLQRELEAHKERNPDGHDDLATYARCIADELASLQAEDPKLAPDDLQEMFEDPPRYEDPDTMGIVWYMLGYAKSAADLLGVAPADLVRTLTG